MTGGGCCSLHVRRSQTQVSGSPDHKWSEAGIGCERGVLLQPMPSCIHKGRGRRAGPSPQALTGSGILGPRVTGS